MTIIHECDRCNAPGRVIETSDGFRCEGCYEEAQEQVRSDASCPECALGAVRLAAHLLLRLLVATLAAESVGSLDHATGRVAPVALVNECHRVDSLHHACIRTVM